MKLALKFYFLVVAGLAINPVQATPDPQLFTVVYQNTPSYSTFAGVVEASQMTTLAAQTSGIVQQVNVDAGAQVKTGQLLIQLSSPEAQQQLQQAQAQFELSQQQLKLAEADWQRAQATIGVEAISREVYQHKESAYLQAQQQTQIAQAQLDQAKTQVGYQQVKAPAAWRISQKMVEQGDWVSPGKPLLQAYNPQQMRVVLSLPQHTLAPPSQAIVWINQQALHPSTLELLPQADAKTHSRQLRLIMPSQNNPPLYPGMSVTVQLNTGSQSRLFIPRSAVIKRYEMSAVYLKTAQGYQLRQIRTGAIEGDNIEVLAGLNPNEQIARDAQRVSRQSSTSSPKQPR